ncbi:MAG: DUF1700 domain-containing protein [Actinobacteria bacterium]|nr:DUF1700 domain-containing protein [Actinomycetota bacterium]
MTVNEPLSASERYLRRLADALEALGPTETSEVLTEVWSHVTDAIADAGSSEEEVLARFGDPEALAARILEERGVGRGGSGAPRAEGWRRIGAVIVDAALWLALVWLFAIPLIGVSMYGLRSYGGAVIAWVVIAAVMGVAAWWWVKKRRERGFTTIGMKAMGLRRVRLGEENRLVRERDIPGLASREGGRIVAVIGAIIALFVLASLTYSVFANQAGQREVEAREAVMSSGQAGSVITSLYREVATGAPLASVEGPFALPVKQAAADLLTRHSQGSVGSYTIIDMNLLEYKPYDETPDGANQTLVSVSVLEYPPGSDVGQIYDYHVGLVVQSQGKGGWSGQWLIQSIDGPHQ